MSSNACPEVKIDDKLVPSIYLPKGMFEIESIGSSLLLKAIFIKLKKVEKDEAKCIYAFGDESGELDFDAVQSFCRSKVPPGNCQNCDANPFVINNEEHHDLVNDNLVRFYFGISYGSYSMVHTVWSIDYASTYSIISLTTPISIPAASKESSIVSELS